MRLLVLGAGATGGYFGGLLAKTGADVTFLVRPARRDQLARDGLKIETPAASVATRVNAITADEIAAPHDAIILSAKAYDLAAAIDTIRPAVGEASLVLPLLNGMKHLEALDAAFGASRVLGGMCQISVTLTADGAIRRFGDMASLTMGPRFREQVPAATKLHEILSRAFEARYSDTIIAAMWEKWFFIAAFASSTCLMRASVGDIVRTDGGAEFMRGLVTECIAVAAANGYPPAPQAAEFARNFLSDPASSFSASMLRDIERGSRIEADQIVGDIIRRGRDRGVPTPLLDVAYVALEAYQNRLRAGP